jgi:hypothetical protein
VPDYNIQMCHDANVGRTVTVTQTSTSCMCHCLSEIQKWCANHISSHAH